MGFSFNLALVRLGWNCQRALTALMQMKGLILLLWFCSWGVRAQIYSFENGLLPAGWSVTSGTLQVTNSKFKLGTNSLNWTWNAGATLTVTNPNGLTVASTNSSGGIYLWIYNPTPSTSNLLFSFLNTANQVKCHADFNLKFSRLALSQCRVCQRYAARQVAPDANAGAGPGCRRWRFLF